VVTDLKVVTTLLLEPTLYMTVLTYVGGFLIMQVAFARGRVSVILPVRIMLSLVCTILLGVLLFAEPVGVGRLGAIFLMFVGVYLLASHSSAETPTESPAPIEIEAARADSYGG
jgi:multidrug transporter EmrE-like cation transporter